MPNIIRPAQILIVGLALALTSVPTLAQAPIQTWPQKTVRFIVPLPPGSGMDLPPVSSPSG